MNSILVVDDEPGVVQAFVSLLENLGHQVVSASTGEEALELCERAPPDLVVSDLCMPGLNGLELFQRIQARWPRLPVIIMTGYGTMETAIEATKLGAFDYHLKPFDPQTMLDAIDRALESSRLMARHVALDVERSENTPDVIVGTSQAMQAVFKAIGRVASTNASVLIRGESGTGKELVARAIYHYGDRAHAPLVTVNCAAIPESLLESELFGYERGAFTGATARKIGKFEQAIKSGAFREDLFYRLNVVTIELPPLRERSGDIPRLVDYFLDRFARELNVEKPAVLPDAMRLLCSDPWPGNVRQLEHCLYRALIFTRGYPLRADDIRRFRDAAGETSGVATGSSDEAIRDLVRSFLASYQGMDAYDEFMRRVDRCLIHETIERTQGNLTQAARLLGLTRPTLYSKMRKSS